MAVSKSMFVCVAFLVVFCFMLLKEDFDCNRGHYGCFVAETSKRHMSRKILAGLMEKSLGEISRNYGNKGLNESELRRVPSGPDPLHHNRNSPKKPRSP